MHWSAVESNRTVSNFKDTPTMRDLPLEVMLCFSQTAVNWPRLIDFVESDPKRNSEPAEIVVRQKYLDDKFEIVSDHYLENPEDFNLLLKVLKLFGQLITKLKVDYKNLNPYQCETINKYLNEFCYDSLIEIEFMNTDDEALSELEGPFKRATHIRLDLDGYPIEGNKIRYDKIFPAVRQFDQDGMGMRFPERFDRKFPHLESLTMEMEMYQAKYWPNLMTRLELNPQLRHVTFPLANWFVLKIIQKQRSKIESVVFERFNNLPLFEDDDPDIELENVRIFKFLDDDIGSRSNRIPLVFGNLKEIVCNKPVDVWFDIIIENKNLRKVQTGELSDKQLFKIVDKLPKLEEFITDHKIANFTDKIVSFIEKGDNLERVQFTQLTDFEVSKKAIRKLGSKWTLGGINTFIRRKKNE